MDDLRQRILFWFAFIAFVAVACWAGHYHFFGKGYFRPALVTEQRIVDFGEVSADSLAEAEISVTNGGWCSLQIEGVRTGCGSCIKIVSFPKEPIRRGETGRVCVTFNSKSLKGKVRRSILILSNDPIQPVYSLFVDAVVQYGEEANEDE